MAELGRTGLSEWSGQIQEDFLKELHGKKGYKKYNEMRMNSPVIGGMLLAIEQALRKITWDVTSDVEDDPRIELVNDSLENMSASFNDHITEALTMLPFGYSVFEIVYERIGAQVLWRKFAIRGQDTVYQWLFDKQGGLAGLVQVVQTKAFDPVTIPIEKLLLYRTRVEKGNPEGRSVLRTAYIPYYYWKNISQIEAIGIERDLAGLPMIKLPVNATTDSGSGSDASKANQLVRNVRNDEQAGIVLPSDWEFELVSTGGTRQFDTDTIIRRYESRMLLSGLAQFLMLGQDKVGSLALSEDQTDFFNMSVNATADIIAETFTKYAIPRLLRLNGMDAVGVVIQHSPAGDVDIMAVADFLQKVGAKITWLPEDEIWLRSLANLNDVDTERIEDERERNAERMMQLRPQFPQQQDDDNMTAQYYRATQGNKPPNDNERRLSEKQIYRLVNRFWEDQKNRIRRGLKET